MIKLRNGNKYNTSLLSFCVLEGLQTSQQCPAEQQCRVCRKQLVQPAVSEHSKSIQTSRAYLWWATSLLIELRLHLKVDFHLATLHNSSKEHMIEEMAKQGVQIPHRS